MCRPILTQAGESATTPQLAKSEEYHWSPAFRLLAYQVGSTSLPSHLLVGGKLKLELQRSPQSEVWSGRLESKY
ncbi:hypothetical protein Pr1d_23160 [Bythopirellula goksoeyrii]|uniref:Uncharacterized protein n=1 Tax=Bythopirellula goksoeyrii TaxID=1400387 RepID=A0A5B9QDK6_9BACT|nr:hypothetical protein Pr1d_23160 [Bythopirellula goksoeyrii]